MKLLAAMQATPVIAVLRIEDPDHALPMARAIVAGGLTLLEVDLHSAAALGAIERIAAEVAGAIVGACDLITTKDLKRATKAGAKFASTPGFSTRLSAEAEIPLLPGVATASEIIKAMEHGHEQLKLFPADLAGGIPALAVFAGLFPRVAFCPAGGVTQAMAPHYLALPNVPCVAASWVAPAKAIHDGNWDHIQFLAHEAATLRTP